MNLTFSWMTQIMAGLPVNGTGSGEQHHMKEADQVTVRRTAFQIEENGRSGRDNALVRPF